MRLALYVLAVSILSALAGIIGNAFALTFYYMVIK